MKDKNLLPPKEIKEFKKELAYFFEHLTMEQKSILKNQFYGQIKDERTT